MPQLPLLKSLFDAAGEFHHHEERSVATVPTIIVKYTEQSLWTAERDPTFALGTVLLLISRRSPDFQARSLHKTVGAVRRALRASAGDAAMPDLSTSRRSSGSVHSPPPNVANMSDDSKAEVNHSLPFA